MSNNTSVVTGDVSKEKLIQDLQLVVSDAEELLKLTASQAGEKISDKVSVARERVQESLVSAKARLAVAEEAMLERTREAARATDEYVHENPWRAVGIAAGVGLVVGMLISRGR
ncbi:MAG: DUF883 family protein [Gallionella sp.]|nr:DUF883 family protein [Gallionella sp.]MDD4945859.1 DUF883 family protein [Gallionella sp.]MDD5611872.1 DUF883 family protein [Gallionella sp.]